MKRAGEYVLAIVAQRHTRAAGRTPVARDGRVVFASVSQSPSCRSILMRGDGRPEYVPLIV